MKIKKNLKRALFILVVLASIIKIYFEIDNYFYKSKLETLENNNELAINIKAAIEHKTLQIEGSKIHYFVSGNNNKKSIVFLHPAFSDHSAFDQQIDYFSNDYKVITIDLIGHGLSKAKKSKDKIDASPDHIIKILELENINQTHLVGVSIGSLVAQYFTLKYPTRVKSLTAIGGYNINKENKEIEKAQRGSNLSLIVRAIFSMKAFRKKTAVMTCKSERGQALFYKTTSHYERKSFMVMQGLNNVVKDRKNIKINYPTLIMTGEFDIELAKEMAQDWHSHLENSDYYIIENGGHCANIDEPIVFNKKVKEFINKNN
jgi:pimeloyl-ACP methyl ester carboxylesterase